MMHKLMMYIVMVLYATGVAHSEVESCKDMLHATDCMHAPISTKPFTSTTLPTSYSSDISCVYSALMRKQV